ncbi:FtsB family cell division protein [Streptomyces vilmorinianum]|uniref:FtsB family cell division protein n=1 Tax=Streptomyces vilmorinianum TaxID=3051092 RepID=UPI0010FB94F0|nr:septum formation initiator family protein [Streptomyces vilmorinianum]
MPSGPSTAARTPFVLLVVLLLGGGLITLLLLNSALNQGSFKLRDLKNRTTELTDEEQALQRDVDDYSAPDALERRARELGMVPGGSPAFLDPDGTVRGKPSKASAPKPDPTPTVTAPPPATRLPAGPPQVAPSGSASPSPDPAAGTPPATPPATTPATAPEAPTTTAPAPTNSGR